MHGDDGESLYQFETFHLAPQIFCRSCVLQYQSIIVFIKMLG
jgi:hypothetical protein